MCVNNDNISCDYIQETEKHEIKRNYSVEFKKIFSNSVSDLISQFYSKLNLTRSSIQLVFNSFTTFLSSGIIKINKDICSYIFTHENTQEKIELNEMLDNLEHPFLSINSEYKRYKYFETSEKLVKPVEIHIGVSDEKI